MKKIVATNVVASRPRNGDRLQRRPLVPKLNIVLNMADNAKATANFILGAFDIRSKLMLV